MDFLPHTPEDVQEMLAAVGLPEVDALFDVIPESVRLRAPLDVPPSLSEPELLRHMRDLGRAPEGGR